MTRVPVCAVLLASVLLGSLSALASEPEGQRPARRSEILPEELRALSPEALVAEIYAQFELALHESGYSEAEIRLAEIRTVYPEQFDSVRIRDVLTLDPPRILSIVSQSQQLSMRLRDGSTYTFPLLTHLEANWKQGFRDSAEEQRSWDPTLAVSFEPSGRGHDLPMPLALTAYRVRIRLGGEEHAWRAYTIWNEWPPRDRLSLAVQDPGLDGTPILEPTFAPRPYRTRAEIERLARAIPDAMRDATAGSNLQSTQP